MRLTRARNRHKKKILRRYQKRSLTDDVCSRGERGDPCATFERGNDVETRRAPRQAAPVMIMCFSRRGRDAKYTRCVLSHNDFSNVYARSLAKTPLFNRAHRWKCNRQHRRAPSHRQDRKFLFAEVEEEEKYSERRGYQKYKRHPAPRAQRIAKVRVHPAKTCALGARIRRACIPKDIRSIGPHAKCTLTPFQTPTRIMPRVIILSCIFSRRLLSRGALNNNRARTRERERQLCRATSARWEKLKSILSPRALGFPIENLASLKFPHEG